MIEQRVTLRYGAQQIPAIVQAVQGDTGRDVIFELADYEIPAGATANYYIDKPDDTAIYNSAEVISSTEILAHLTEQALAVPGRNDGQVRILSDGEVITSFDFVLEVEAFRGILRLQSETEVNIFDEALHMAAEDAIEEIQAQTPVVTGMQNSIAPSYSASSTYAVGDYVMYNAQLYRCKTAIDTAEIWTAEHWTQVSISTDVLDLKSQIHADRYDEIFDESVYESGGINVYNGNNLDNYTTRIRTKSYLPKNVCFIKPKDGYKVSLYVWSESKTYLGVWNGSSLVRQAADANWTTEGWDLKALDRSYYFKVALAFTDDTDITTSAYNQLIATYATDAELKRIGIPADAKATSDAIASSTEDVAKILCESDVDFTFSEGYYNASGELQSSYNHVEISVNPSEIYSFQTRYGSAIFPWLIMDASDNIIDIYNGGHNNDAWNTVKSFVVSMPDNAAKLIVQTNNTTSGYVYIRKVIGNKIFDMVKWCCIGDSLTDPTPRRATKKYYDYIQEKTGVTFVNLGVSGTGYANDYGGAGTFDSRVSSIPDDTDILTIFGGGNDLNTLPIGTHTDTTNDTLMGCVYLTLQDVFTSKPNVLVGIISPTPWMQYPPYTADNKMLVFTEELKQLCAMYSVPCLDLYHNSNLRPWDATFRENYYSRDDGGGTHPDERGNARFSGQILEFLKEILYS